MRNRPMHPNCTTTLASTITGNPLA